MPSNPQRLYLLDAITSEVAAAVNRGDLLRSHSVAEELAARFSGSGMTVEEIEDEILRQTGQAKGAAEFGATATRRQKTLAL